MHFNQDTDSAMIHVKFKLVLLSTPFTFLFRFLRTVTRCISIKTQIVQWYMPNSHLYYSPHHLHFCLVFAYGNAVHFNQDTDSAMIHVKFKLVLLSTPFTFLFSFCVWFNMVGHFQGGGWGRGRGVYSDLAWTGVCHLSLKTPTYF